MLRNQGFQSLPLQTGPNVPEKAKSWYKRNIELIKQYKIILICMLLVTLIWVFAFSYYMKRPLPEKLPGELRKEEIKDLYRFLGAQNTLNNITHDVTLVTSYFVFGSKAKHQINDYQNWIRNFLAWVETPIVIFTEPAVLPLISKFRRDKPTNIQLYDGIWETPFVKERNLQAIYETQQHDLDPEKYAHSAELYAIWNSKLKFLSIVANELNPFGSKYFYWIDIGTFRERDFHVAKFPSAEICAKTFQDNEDKFHIFTVNEFLNYTQTKEYELKDMKMDFMIGGFFGGMVSGVQWFRDEFYKLHDDLVSQKVFVGKDQTLYNWIVMHHLEKVFITCSCKQDLEACGSKWFIFQEWYVTPEERRKDCEVSIPLVTGTEYFNITARFR